MSSSLTNSNVFHEQFQKWRSVVICGRKCFIIFQSPWYWLYSVFNWNHHGIDYIIYRVNMVLVILYIQLEAMWYWLYSAFSIKCSPTFNKNTLASETSKTGSGMDHSGNPNTKQVETGRRAEFKASLAYTHWCLQRERMNGKKEGKIESTEKMNQ